MRVAKPCRYEEFLPALASEPRQTILERLIDQEMTVTELTAEIRLSQPTVSHHLAILRRAGLVKVRRQGQRTFYTTNTHCLIVCCQRLFDQLGVPWPELGPRGEEGSQWPRRRPNSKRREYSRGRI